MFFFLLYFDTFDSCCLFGVFVYNMRTILKKFTKRKRYLAGKPLQQSLKGLNVLNGFAWFVLTSFKQPS